MCTTTYTTSETTDPLIQQLVEKAPVFPNSELSGIVRQPTEAQIHPNFENSEYMGPNIRAYIDSTKLCAGKPNGWTQCSTDCLSRVFCDDALPNGIRTTDLCSYHTPYKRYCSPDTFSCVEQIDRCIVKINATNCTQNFTSDLTDCRKYTYCNGDGYLYQYYCVYPSVFDPATNTCKSGYCNNFSDRSLCRDHYNKLVAWPGSPDKFVLCVHPPVLFKCYPNFQFNQKAQSCTFICPGAGRFANVGDTTNMTWYECIKSGLTIIAYQRRCEDGTHFDPNVGSVNNTGVCHF